jgi:hypothetical protein
VGLQPPHRQPFYPRLLIPLPQKAEARRMASGSRCPCRASCLSDANGNVHCLHGNCQ